MFFGTPANGVFEDSVTVRRGTGKETLRHSMYDFARGSSTYGKAVEYEVEASWLSSKESSSKSRHNEKIWEVS